MAAKRAAKTDKGAERSEAPKKLRANAGAEEVESLEPLFEPSANRDIAGVVLAVIAIASFIAVVSPESAPVTRAVAGFYHLGFGLGAFVLPIVLLFFAASLFLKESSPVNARSLAGGSIVFIAIISLLSLLLSEGTGSVAGGMYDTAVLSRSGGYVGAAVASVLEGALGKTIAAVVLAGVMIVGFIVIGFSVSAFFRGAAEHAHSFADRHAPDVNDSPWGDEEAFDVPAAPATRHIGLFDGLAAEPRKKAGSRRAAADDEANDSAVTRLMGVSADDEDEDPFVDVSEQVEAERAKTRLIPIKDKVSAAAGRAGRRKGASAAADVAKTTLLDDSAPEHEDIQAVALDAFDTDDEDDLEQAPFDVLGDEGASSAPASAGRVGRTAAAAPAAAPAAAGAAASTAGSNTAAANTAIPSFLLHPKSAVPADSDTSEPVSLDDDGRASEDDVVAAKRADEVDAGSEDELTLPPESMLRHNPKSASAASSDKELEQTAEALQGTLVEFGRTARVVGWISGPTVTTFKLQPGEGERVSKITALEDDIALSLAAQSVRIFAPIPGTSLVGIEIPNRTRQNVYLGDVLPYIKGGPLELAIGRDAEGTPIVADLAKMPHLLIAGTTGSGKSVMINSIITTLLMRARPDDVRLVMVDPKRVELAGYNGLPHLYVPVVTEPKQAASALQWAVSEMERRLKVFERLSVRKISDYNERQAAGAFEHYDNPPKKMPYLVIIIDELSDLMMVAGKDVEASIVRIAQLGRAAGIHLIVATQRPSSNVVTGLIKANISNRIAFNVATGIDSRVIIDQMGAEKLTGLGDMLFSKVGWGKPRRIQGCFVSDEEINEIVEFVKSQSEPDYHEEILSAVAPGMAVATGAGPLRTGTAEPEDDDPLIWEAAQIVVETQLGSTSGLQRRLKVGYARAGRIMDMLEEKGVVGPPDGSKPREVLLDEEGLAALKSVDAEMAAEDDLFGGF